MRKATVYNAIDRPSLWRSALAGKRVGLITNPSGTDRSLRLTSDILHEAGLLRCLLAPEHGIRGDRQAGDRIASYTDEQTGLPAHSLYGGSHHIPPEVLKELDAIAFDIQDVGARFYTYIYTLSYAMEDCAAADKEIIVFDRVNPLGGTVEGTLLEAPYASFVGRYPLATRTGLTVGEFARYINETQKIGCRLTVIPIDGWQRNMLFENTDLCWIAPSPNLPTPDSALCYIGTCLFEGTNLSEGRGTTRPFETIGAPWLRAEEIAEQMRATSPPGVKIRACSFTPTFSKYREEMCRGIQLHITDPTFFRPFEVGLHLLDLIRRTHSEFALTPADQNGIRMLEKLLGCHDFCESDFDIHAFLDRQAVQLAQYQKEISPHLIYK